jgi:hypothetical protein
MSPDWWGLSSWSPRDVAGSKDHAIVARDWVLPWTVVRGRFALWSSSTSCHYWCSISMTRLRRRNTHKVCDVSVCVGERFLVFPKGCLFQSRIEGVTRSRTLVNGVVFAKWSRKKQFAKMACHCIPNGDDWNVKHNPLYSRAKAVIHKLYQTGLEKMVPSFICISRDIAPTIHGLIVAFVVVYPVKTLKSVAGQHI